MDPASATSLAYARKLVREQARNFYYGILLLPRRKQDAVCALYAFCRVLDDAVDISPGGAPSASSIRERFARIAEGREPLRGDDRRLSQALAAVARRFPISRRHLDWIVDGVVMDLDPGRYPTFGALQKYLFGVASAVGLACIEIFGYRTPLARRFAVYLGYAMQLTNILRDVKEDYCRGRVYVPAEDLARFGVAEAELGEPHASPALRRLLAFEARRARDLFRAAEGLWPLLARDAAPCPYAIARIYEELLGEIERGGFDVLGRRFGISPGRKLLLMLRAKAAFLL